MPTLAWIPSSAPLDTEPRRYRGTNEGNRTVEHSADPIEPMQPSACSPDDAHNLVAGSEESAPSKGRKVESYDFDDIGVEHAQYFQGYGSDGADEYAYGTGSTPREALDDALEMIAQDTETDPEELDRIEREILADYPADHWDSDTSLVDELRSGARGRTYRVRFASYSGMRTVDETYGTLADALAKVDSIVAAREKTGHAVDSIGAPMPTSEDADTFEFGTVRKYRDTLAEYRIEVEEPEGCAMIPDTAGILSLDILAGDMDTEQFHEHELSYYVGIRIYWRDESASEEKDGAE